MSFERILIHSSAEREQKTAMVRFFRNTIQKKAVFWKSRMNNILSSITKSKEGLGTTPQNSKEQPRYIEVFHLVFLTRIF